MTYADICQRRRDLHRSRLADRAAAETAAVALYPSMSTRDIARNMGVTINFVEHAAKKAGLTPRPAAMVPGEPYHRSMGRRA